MTARAVGAGAHIDGASRCPIRTKRQRRAHGVTPMAMYCADGANRWMADDGVRQPPKDGCIIVAPGWLAYLGSVEGERIYRRRAVVEVICKVIAVVLLDLRTDQVLAYTTALRRFSSASLAKLLPEQKKLPDSLIAAAQCTNYSLVLPWHFKLKDKQIETL